MNAKSGCVQTFRLRPRRTIVQTGYVCMYVCIYIYVRYDVLEYSNSTLKSRGTAAAACYGTQSS